MGPFALRSLCATSAALLLSSASLVHADWPSDGPIAVSVGFAAGGSTDVMARIIAPFVAKHLGDGASFVIHNRPGASGEIAINSVMHAKPDGYSLVIVNLPGYFFVPMYRKASYTTKDITLIARVVRDPTVMVVPKDSRFDDLESVLSALKASPSAVSAGHNGIGTNGHLAMARLETAAGVRFNAVPYNSTANQKMALASRTLDAAFIAASEVPDPNNEARPLRLLAQFDRNRVQRMASVPTTFELGYQVEMTAERGFAAPNGVPAPILARLQKAIEDAIKDPEYIKAALNDAPFLAYLGGADWTREVDRDRKAYEALAGTVARE